MPSNLDKVVRRDFLRLCTKANSDADQASASQETIDVLPNSLEPHIATTLTFQMVEQGCQGWEFLQTLAATVRTVIQPRFVNRTRDVLSQSLGTVEDAMADVAFVAISAIPGRCWVPGLIEAVTGGVLEESLGNGTIWVTLAKFTIDRCAVKVSGVWTRGSFEVV